MTRINSIETMYERRSPANYGPLTYKDLTFSRQIAEAAGLTNHTLETRNVLDIMSGPGLLALDFQAINQHVNYFLLDRSVPVLSQVEERSFRKVAADARKIPFKDDAFHIVDIRYGAKDEIKDKQLELFKEMYRVTRPGGRLVLVDMYGPTEEMANWVTAFHSHKQQMSGRNIAVEGECHIPTKQGWKNLLTQVGFRAEEASDYHSLVNTKDWVRSNQIEWPDLIVLNRQLENAPQHIKEAFGIRRVQNERDEVDVLVRFPVAILVGHKAT